MSWLTQQLWQGWGSEPGLGTFKPTVSPMFAWDLLLAAGGWGWLDEAGPQAFPAKNRQRKAASRSGCSLDSWPSSPWIRLL